MTALLHRTHNSGVREEQDLYPLSRVIAAADFRSDPPSSESEIRDPTGVRVVRGFSAAFRRCRELKRRKDTALGGRIEAALLCARSGGSKCGIHASLAMMS
jgi:hypothetical protein